MQSMFAYLLWSVDTLITSKVNAFEDVWLSFQVRKTINTMFLELHRKKCQKYELPTPKNQIH